MERPDLQQRLRWGAIQYRTGGVNPTAVVSLCGRYSVCLVVVGGARQYEAWERPRDRGAVPARLIRGGLPDADWAKAVCEWEALAVAAAAPAQQGGEIRGNGGAIWKTA